MKRFILFGNRRKNSLRNLVLCLLASVAICAGQTGCNLGQQANNVSGRQAFELGQFPTAVNEFQKALARNPNNPDTLYNLGASLYAQGKQTRNAQWLGQAEQLYRQSIAANDQHVDAHRGLAALLIETGREKYAFDLINQWKDRYPGSTEPVVELARLYQEYGDNRRATDLLADALKIDSNSIRALKAMGHVREVQGQTHLALDNYLRVLQINNQDASVAQRVASLQSQLARPANGNVNSAPTANPSSRYGAVDPYLQR